MPVTPIYINFLLISSILMIRISFTTNLEFVGMWIMLIIFLFKQIGTFT